MNTIQIRNKTYFQRDGFLYYKRVIQGKYEDKTNYDEVDKPYTIYHRRILRKLRAMDKTT